MDKPSFYSVLPACVRYSEELSWFEKILYAEITSLCNKDGYCFAKNSYFADVFDLSESQVRRAIGNLSRLGFVRVLIENGNERKIYITDSSSNAEESAESTERREKETKGVQDEGVRKNAGARKNETEGAQKCASLVDTTSTVDSNINNINNNIKKIYLSVLEKLNEVCGSGFRDSAKNKKHIVARIREGYSLADFEVVIRSQHALWGNDPVMCRYLRPETLFGSKFAGYLEAAKMAERAKANGRPKQSTGILPQAEAGRKAEEIPKSVIEERMRFMFGGGKL